MQTGAAIQDNLCLTSCSSSILSYVALYTLMLHCVCLSCLKSILLSLSAAVYICISAKEKGEKKLFGFSFMPLMQENGRTLPDGTHELIVHKVICISSH